MKMTELHRAILETVGTCDDDRAMGFTAMWPRFDDGSYLVDWNSGSYADKPQSVIAAVHDLEVAGYLTEADSSAGSWKLTRKGRNALQGLLAA